METCVRGFSNSFVPENQIEPGNLPFIEDNELERAWKTTRRMRLKKQEQKIWDEFVKEQDILSSVLNDDPYQFLEQLPAPCLREMMETELVKMKTAIEESKEKSQSIVEMVLQQDKPEAKIVMEDVVETAFEQPERPCETTLVQLVQSESEVFHIYDDGTDEEQAESVESTPRTVRDRTIGTPPPELCSSQAQVPPDMQNPPETQNPHSSSKASENMEAMIESSISCAKVKELRIKISDELAAIMTSLEKQDLVNLDRAEVRRLCKRSAEFCGRFHRIHVYQLHRQVQDIKRHSTPALPFAKHTQFQSQIVRIVSLHQNMLQSFQAFHKSFEQTACLRESCDELNSLIQLVRDAGSVCAKATLGHRAVEALSLFNDELVNICGKVDEAVKEYRERADNMSSHKTRSTTQTKKSLEKKDSKNKSSASWMKLSSKSKTDDSTRLSMYSMDTLRHAAASCTSSRENRHARSKAKGEAGEGRGTGLHTSRRTRRSSPKPSPKTPKGWRKPLMRGPREQRAPRGPAETDIRTMVEIEPLSSHISCEGSPETSPRPPKTKGTGGCTPRNVPVPAQTPRKRVPTVYLREPRVMSPRSGRCPSPLSGRCPSPLSGRCPSPLSGRCPSPLSGRGSTPHSGRELSPNKPLSSRRLHRFHRVEAGETLAQGPVSPVAQKQFVQRKAEDKSMGNTRQVAQKESVMRQREEMSHESPREQTPSTVEAKSKILPSLDPAIASCEVTRLLRQLCGGDVAVDRSRTDRVSGAKNAQLLCVNGASPRQPSTPQLLKILEETIQKKIPKSMYPNQKKKDINERIRLTFNIPQKTADSMFHYRTKFLQFMLNSSMYANSAIGKPWEIIGSVSEEIIDELLMGIVKDMELSHVIKELYRSETK